MKNSLALFGLALARGAQPGTIDTLWSPTARSDCLITPASWSSILEHSFASEKL